MTAEQLTKVADKKYNVLNVELRGDGYFNASRICKNTKRLWTDYQRNKRTQELLEQLAHITNCAPADLVQSKNGGVTPGTWVHPAVLPDLQRWCSYKKRKRAAGYIYVVTSDVLNAAKIGLWSGSTDNLRARYLTPYGPTLEMTTAIVSDCGAAEAELHRRFEQHSLGGELFDKRFLQDYKDAILGMDE